MPGDDDRRPRQEPPPATTTNQTQYACPDHQSGAPDRPRFCVVEVLRRRRFARELDSLLAELYPNAPVEPSTFSLTDGELRRHGNDLHASGWSIEEILSLLDIDVLRRS